mmetsp:Transcript_20231/g.26729  ORF Transcript_20231/g.26729 Transcript_20231/m.26729 type:complete len:624 (+) Transcript_20231:257-2128(+)|eukprot:CAMPEP_0117753206 /NCGR_PEP_ID=MMETSP0947-20121206/12078_1 /TAXON_ID=44440 /ORGANISM="Chattonella subsalsa, Strain CCMP2191" /LENGTH=623 /DNA_ID=CAMNT_0005572025 /DNA_START=191 /DNA_END=2062 /DNA_ORIENTATION=-
MEENAGNYSYLVDQIDSLMSKIAMLEAQLSGIEPKALAAVINSSESNAWLFILLSSFNIFLMQAGFALLEVGTVQAKNAKSILYKNSLDTAVSMMVWWGIGFGIAGDGASGQIGRNFLCVADQNTISFLHSYVFAGASATIISGGVAERMCFSAYLLFSVFMVGLVYPVVVQWTWSSSGWMNQLGYLDFAGSGVIHLCGGLAALVGAILLGPRIGRFKHNREDRVVEIIDIKGHSPVLSNLGTFILLFGWLSFNGSSVLGGSQLEIMTATRAVLNTLLAVSTCAITSFVWGFVTSWGNIVHTHNLEELNNSILAGAVGITAACVFVKGWAAVVIGFVAFFVYTKSANIIKSFHIDDPLEASAVHGACGLWGVIAVGIFAHPELVADAGIIYGGSWNLFGIQILGALTIITWTLPISFILLKLIGKLPGFTLRVDKDAELLGLDFAYHDGFAYQGLTPESISYHNELKAAELRVRARNRGIIRERKKVKDLKIRKKRRKIVVIDGVEMEVSMKSSQYKSDSDASNPFDPKETTTTTAVLDENKEKSYDYSPEASFLNCPRNRSLEKKETETSCEIAPTSEIPPVSSHIDGIEFFSGEEAKYFRSFSLSHSSLKPIKESRSDEKF